MPTSHVRFLPTTRFPSEAFCQFKNLSKDGGEFGSQSQMRLITPLHFECSPFVNSGNSPWKRARDSNPYWGFHPTAYRSLLAYSVTCSHKNGPSGESRTRNPLGRQSLKLLRIAISATDGFEIYLLVGL